MLSAPLGFEETPLGELKGATRQYRGPDNLHFREYEDGWELHQDFGDPRTLGGFIIHIILDAPEVGLVLLIAVCRFKELYDETHSFWPAVGEALKSGVIAFVGVRIMKEFIEYLVRWTADTQKSE